MIDDLKSKRMSIELHLNNKLGDRALACDDVPEKKALDSLNLNPMDL